MDSEYNPSNIYTYPQTKKLIRMIHIFKSPNFLIIDRISNDYITNHNKKYHLFLIKCDFKLNFNNDFLKPIHIETDFYYNTKFINLKRYLFYQIDIFIERGYIFSCVAEMNITTVNGKMYMRYDYYIQHPLPSIEVKMNMILATNPYLKNRSTDIIFTH